jgi:hypothetical protein
VGNRFGNRDGTFREFLPRYRIAGLFEASHDDSVSVSYFLRKKKQDFSCWFLAISSQEKRSDYITVDLR